MEVFVTVSCGVANKHAFPVQQERALELAPAQIFDAPGPGTTQDKTKIAIDAAGTKVEVE